MVVDTFSSSGDGVVVVNPIGFATAVAPALPVCPSRLQSARVESTGCAAP